MLRDVVMEVVLPGFRHVTLGEGQHCVVLVVAVVAALVGVPALCAVADLLVCVPLAPLFGMLLCLCCDLVVDFVELRASVHCILWCTGYVLE